MKKTVNEKKNTGKAEKAGADKKSVEKVVPLPVTDAEAPSTEGAVVPQQEAAAPVRTVDTVTLEIVTLKRQAGQVLMGYAIEIGRRLVEVKEMLPHGEWGNYLRERVEYSQSTAESFMRLFREYGEEQQSLFGAEAKSQTLAILPYSKALALLALPADEREEFAAEHDVEGMSTRELQAAIRAKEEAEAEARNAEASRAKMEADMAAANAHMVAAKAEAEAARAAKEEADDQVAELRKKLAEQEARPVEVVGTSTPDPEALDAAREEGVRAAREEADRAAQALRDQLERAEAKRQEAEARAREAESEARAAEKQAREAEREKQELQKRVQVAGNPIMAAANVHFESVQRDFGLLLDDMDKLRSEGALENHDKLVGAAHALLEALGGRVPGKAAC